MRLITFLFIVALNLTVSAQEDTDAIRELVQLMDSRAVVATYNETSIDDERNIFSKLELHEFGQGYRKLTTTSRSETAESEHSYYLHEGNLIFVLERIVLFSRVPNWEEAKSESLGMAEFKDATKVKSKTVEYFFESGSLIKWNSVAEPAATRAEYIKKERWLMNQLNTLLSNLD